ncbi:MAG: IS66 family transposase, partial [Acidobacteria bacterium]|nr:IS66 family transposase [Acidobacteriota bacterium]
GCSKWPAASGSRPLSAAKNAFSLQAEVRRLHNLLADAGVASHRSSVIGLRREIVRLRKDAPRAEVQARKIRKLHKANWQLRVDKAALRRILYDAMRDYDETRRLGDQAERVRALKGETLDLRYALRRAETVTEKLKVRLVGAVETARSMSPPAADAELRRALRRSRRQKTALNALTKENARLHRTVRNLQRRTGMQETVIAKLRATRAVLSKALHGRRSEKRERPGTGRPRGQVQGAPGHGRTPRPGLEERVEEHNPPEEARTCGDCGKPYAAVGAEQSALVEIEVKAHRRVIRRGRWRRTCGCPASPVEVSAPPVPRLFPNTPYGTSVWSRVLYERYACLRPARRVGAWLGDQGMPVAAGTLADSVPRFVPLFEPLAEAILEHQTAAALRHADETGWRGQSLRKEGRSARAWLWISVGNDAVYFHIDPSRSAEAARTLFGEFQSVTVIVCDRYSAYKKLARLLGGLVILQYCWSHVRRDYIQCAAGQADLAGWCEAWLERIAAIYRLNKERLSHYDPVLACQSAAFDAAQDALETALDDVFVRAGRELAGLADDAREAKALRSLVNHREGLSVFVDHPRTPMDNNLGERLLRDAVIGRRLSFGSDSRTGAHLTALMYSVIGTLNLNGIDVLRWLYAWLAACAENGGRPPDDLAPWLPWSMEPARRRELTAPG